MAPPKFRGYGLTGKIKCNERTFFLQARLPRTEVRSVDHLPQSALERAQEVFADIGAFQHGVAWLSAPKSQRFLRFAIAMPIADPRNRAISETRESNAALRFKGAMESR